MFYFQTNALGFTPEFLGRVRLAGSLASLAGRHPHTSAQSALRVTFSRFKRLLHHVRRALGLYSAGVLPICAKDSCKPDGERVGAKLSPHAGELRVKGLHCRCGGVQLCAERCAAAEDVPVYLAAGRAAGHDPDPAHHRCSAPANILQGIADHGVSNPTTISTCNMPFLGLLVCD